MKNIKFYLSTLILFCFLISTASATEIYPVNNGEPKTLTEQLSDLLEQVDLSSLVGEKEMLIDFVINSRKEILVLATNDKEFDQLVKTTLNYKKLDNKQLTINVRYTIPVTFKRL